MASKRSGDRHEVKPVSYRIPRPLVERFKVKAAEEGKTATAVLIRLMQRYVDDE